MKRRPSDTANVFDQMDRLFNSIWGQPSMGPMTPGNPIPIDIYEREGAFFVRAAVPGLKPAEIDVSIDDNVLTISGETSQDIESGEGTKIYRRETRYGRFSRSIALPEALDLDDIQAQFENGFVTIRIPSSEVRKPEPRKIEVKAIDSGSNSSPKS
ncbi:MAG: Hsp20/alpha crystallin family protein [Fimbriimonadaceae bacterium]|nr:Hsp20/alpha crystallin family protein [Fimbriimonadaceae bacterium]